MGQGPEEKGNVLLLEAEQEEQGRRRFKGIQFQRNGGVWIAGSYKQVQYFKCINLKEPFFFNRTQFQHQDNLVPWKLKGDQDEEKVGLGRKRSDGALTITDSFGNGPLHHQLGKHNQSYCGKKTFVLYSVCSHSPQVLLRYYHVFEEGELEELVKKVEDLVVVESYYDQGNWCSVLERV